MNPPIVIKNRGYVKALQEIYKIMLNQELVQNYEDYLAVTEGDKVAAAILTLADVRQGAEKAAEEPNANFEMREAPEMPHGYTVKD
jgi:hypothetical protein